MKLFYLSLLVSLSISVLAHPSFAADDSADKAVKDALRTSLIAMFEHDAKTLKEAAAPMDDDQWKKVLISLGDFQESDRLTEEVYKHFPDTADGWPEERPEVVKKQILKMLEETPVTWTDGKATVAMERMSPFPLKKSGPAWKVDVYAYLVDGKHIDAAGWAERTKRRTASISKIADRVAAGQFKTVSDVMQAVGVAGEAAISK